MRSTLIVRDGTFPHGRNMMRFSFTEPHEKQEQEQDMILTGGIEKRGALL